MPDINFASVGPGISMFNSNMAQGDMQRRQAEEDALRRVQFEQAQGADAAQRAAATGYFSNPAGAPPAQAAPVVVPSAPAQVPNPAATTPIVSPSPSLNPADNPDYGGAPPRAAPMPNAVPGPGAGVPATVSAPPAISSFSAQPPAAAPPRNRFADMAGTLAKAPGTGAALMNMVGTSMTSDRAAAVEQRKMEHEAIASFVAAGKAKDIDSMRLVNRQYKLGIPEESLNHRETAFQLMSSMDLAEHIGKATNPEMVIGFSKGYMHAKADGMTDQQAIQAGNTEALKAPRTPKNVHWFPSDTGEMVGVSPTSGADPIHSGVKARPQKWEVQGGGGGGRGAGSAGGQSKAQINSQWRIDTLVKGWTANGVPEAKARADAQVLVAGGASSRPVSQKERVSLARGLMSAKDQSGFKPLYKNFNEALAEVDKATGGGQPDAAGPAAPNNDPLGIRK